MALSANSPAVAPARAKRPAPSERPAAPLLHDWKVRLMRARLAELALTPLLERGFDAVTIDELAEAAGISRRTFFRYFATKEELVIGTFDEAGVALLAELEHRVATEAPLTALRSTLDAIITAFGGGRGRGLETLDLIRRTPALRGHFLVKQDDWTLRIAAILVSRAEPGDASAPMRAQLTARVAMAAIDTMLLTWSERPSADLRTIAQETFDGLGAVVREVEDARRPTKKIPKTPKRGVR
jgi:AcrR family transcriptional regulator